MEMTKAQKRKYIYNLSKKLVHELGLLSSMFSRIDEVSLPRHLFTHYGNIIGMVLRQDYNPNTTAKIARCGVGCRTDLYYPVTLRDVHGGTWLYANKDGDELVRDLAVMAIVAMIAENIMFDRRRPPEASLGSGPLGETLSHEVAHRLK